MSECCGRPVHHSPRGGKIGDKVNILNEKKIDFLPITNCKSLIQIKGCIINKYIFFLNFVFFIKGAIVISRPGRQNPSYDTVRGLYCFEM